MNWFQRLVPHTLLFFPLFERHATTVTAAAEALRQMLEGGEHALQHCRDVMRYEEEADAITRLLGATPWVWNTPGHRTCRQNSEKRLVWRGKPRPLLQCMSPKFCCRSRRLQERSELRRIVWKPLIAVRSRGSGGIDALALTHATLTQHTWRPVAAAWRGVWRGGAARVCGPCAGEATNKRVKHLPGRVECCIVRRLRSALRRRCSGICQVQSQALDQHRRGKDAAEAASRSSHPCSALCGVHSTVR
jgi:hypothetical protein